MKQNKTNLNDLLTQIRDLNEKYLIQDFSEESKKLFGQLNIDSSHVDEIIRNPLNALNGKLHLGDIGEETFQKCIKDYKNLKKKYKYDSYIREGHALRKSFLQQRKNYIFNSAKFIKFQTSGRTSPLEKLSIDYAEQHFISRWVDKLLKRIYPRTLMIQYEDLSGYVKTAEIQYRKISLTPEYVEAPLIDRLIGESVFDTFLLHSFYNVETQSHEYFPVKFIIQMRSKDYPTEAPELDV